jgi:uncharacterized protein YdhG (YjbR/CyaY superfamily)
MAAARSVDEYTAALPPATRDVLERVRATLRRAVPGAEEVISYGIPTLKMNGRPVIYFAGWKEHFSIYPSNATLVAAFKRELAGYETDAKGTIRFPLTGRLPVKLLADIARFRARQAQEEGRRRVRTVKTRPAKKR